MMIKHRFLSILLFIFTLIFVFSSAFAGDADRVGTSSGTQVTIPVGGRDIALGGSAVATTSGLEALFWNPAGLSKFNGNAQGMFSTMNYLADIKVNYFAAGVNLGAWGVLAIRLKALNFGEIPLTTNQDPYGDFGRTFSPTFTTAGLSWARNMTDVIQVGLNMKLIYESVPRASASALAFDIGIQYHNFGNINGLSFGLVVKNIGTNMSYSGAALLDAVSDPENGSKQYMSRTSLSCQLPASVDFGFSYDYELAPMHKLDVSALFQHNNFSHDLARFGLEYGYNDFLFGRVGYIMPTGGSEDYYVFGLTAGLGLKYKIGNSFIIFDYAYQATDYFDPLNIFSFRFQF